MDVTAAGQYLLCSRAEALRHALIPGCRRDETGVPQRSGSEGSDASSGLPCGVGHDSSPFTQLCLDVGKIARRGGLGFHHVALQLRLDAPVAGRRLRLSSSVAVAMTWLATERGFPVRTSTSSSSSSTPTVRMAEVCTTLTWSWSTTAIPQIR